MRNISLVNDIKNTCSPNAVNARGRKLCPITFDILTCNNTINIDGVLYSTKGFSQWVRSELEKDYARLEITRQRCDLLKEKSFFIKFLHIRSPMTNQSYELSVISTICNVFIWQYYKEPISCVYDFIIKYKEIAL
jgi:hypothetical protein